MHSIVFHGHQKIDKVAYGFLIEILPEHHNFPKLKNILEFEGSKGPDSSNLKQNPSDQPWHFIAPAQATADDQLIKVFSSHQKKIIKALSADDQIRAAFEAAWLAHALVDGLTPAHHYPYEELLSQLRGEPRQSRRGLIGRLYVSGDNLLHSLLQSLKLVGPKGLLTTHAAFEAGAFLLISPLRLAAGRPTKLDTASLKASGLADQYIDALKRIDSLKIYDRFIHYGWGHGVGRDVRRQLAPAMVRQVALGWLSAYQQAELRQ